MSLHRKKFTTEVGGKELAIELSSIAEQANAAVLARYGQTVVLVTVVMGHRDGTSNYMPLKVDYEERFYAAGKVIGSRFVRREGRPSEEAVLAARLVDRSIRPLFDNRLRREIQVVATVLAFDEENDPDFVGLIAASLALGVSNIPWAGPVAGVRIGKVGGQFVVNPSTPQCAAAECSLELFASGPKGRINMIELGGKEVSEKEVEEACALAQREIDALAAFQEKIIEEVGRAKEEITFAQAEPELRKGVMEFLSSRLDEAVFCPDKVEREHRMRALFENTLSHVKENAGEGGVVDSHAVSMLFEEAADTLIHKNILEKERRPDGRGLREVRELYAEVGLFERTHGSAIFVRGNTQALAVATLAPPGAEQLVETMETTGKRRFLLHYNFPPYSVGETGFFRGPGRREIGHGALAKKAVEPLIPTADEFPYTIRIVSEVLSSNGSSSMATVCAASLALMDAGVPLKKPAAGIAMGIIVGKGEEGKGKEQTYKILTDIQGPEDHFGDMDFKVAGTADGITAVQLDVKMEGLSLQMIHETLAAAKEARLHILKTITGTLAKPRETLSRFAPVILQLSINPEKIGMVIGPGGKVINGLIRKYGLTGIDIEETGRVSISATDIAKAQAAFEEVKSMTREFKVGDIVEGTVVKILEFGAIVDLGGGMDGMVHVSELKNGFTKDVKEVLKLGDFVRVKVVRVEDGRIALSLKALS
jgi:polyribonucleotide nucleotidyltransferase